MFVPCRKYALNLNNSLTFDNPKDAITGEKKRLSRTKTEHELECYFGIDLDEAGKDADDNADLDLDSDENVEDYEHVKNLESLVNVDMSRKKSIFYKFFNDISFLPKEKKSNVNTGN